MGKQSLKNKALAVGLAVLGGVGFTQIQGQSGVRSLNETTVPENGYEYHMMDYSRYPDYSARQSVAFNDYVYGESTVPDTSKSTAGMITPCGCTGVATVDAECEAQASAMESSVNVDGLSVADQLTRDERIANDLPSVLDGIREDNFAAIYDDPESGLRSMELSDEPVYDESDITESFEDFYDRFYRYDYEGQEFVEDVEDPFMRDHLGRVTVWDTIPNDTDAVNLVDNLNGNGNVTSDTTKVDSVDYMSPDTVGVAIESGLRGTVIGDPVYSEEVLGATEYPYTWMYDRYFVNAEAFSPSDAEILHILITLNNGEILTSEPVSGSSAEPYAREFADEMIQHHRMALQKAQSLATDVMPQTNMISAAIENSAIGLQSKLVNMDGDDKTATYINGQLAMHQNALDLLDTSLIPNAENEDVKALLNETRAGIATHLEEVQHLYHHLD